MTVVSTPTQTIVPSQTLTMASSTETGSLLFNAAGRTGLNDARFQGSTRMTIVVTTPTRIMMGPSAIPMTVYPIAADSPLADLDGSSVLRSAKFRYSRTMKVEITPILTMAAYRIPTTVSSTETGFLELAVVS